MNEKRQTGTGTVSYVNLFLIAVNVAVYVIGLIPWRGVPAADSLFQRGALYAPLILKAQGFHRLLTSVFLHADASHLVNNMIMQYAGGDIVERNTGHFRYLMLYIFCGIGGNLFSVLSDYMTRSYGYSIGASGAVFGVTGALVYMILREACEGMRHGEDKSLRGGAMSPRMKSLVIRAVLMIVWLLYSGWRNPVVNQAAHVGGLICGFLFAALFMPRGKRDLSSLLQ